MLIDCLYILILIGRTHPILIGGYVVGMRLLVASCSADAVRAQHIQVSHAIMYVYTHALVYMSDV
jgi:putative effector of murein hydrolase LrgA (UPF0299 family)